jgi:hypothetical protein
VASSFIRSGERAGLETWVWAAERRPGGPLLKKAGLRKANIFSVEALSQNKLACKAHDGLSIFGEMSIVVKHSA